MSTCCYVCGSIEPASDADPRSPTCEECRPARDHVVSMQTGEGGTAVAVCACGWRFQSKSTGPGRHVFREAAVRAHWRAMIAAAAAQVPA